MRNLKRTVCYILALMLIVSALMPADVSAASYENTYQPTGDQRLDIIGVARTQIGYKEGPNNQNKYGAWYRLDNVAWCAIFISWCARQVDIPTSVIRNTALAAPKHFGTDCKDGLEYTPQLGDLFFTKTFSHVGMVYHVDGEYFYTIEGNSNNDGSDNGDRVVCNRRKTSDYYFSTPNYRTTAEVTGMAEVSVDRTDYRQGENQKGETVNISWISGQTDAVSQTLIIYYNGDILVEQPLALDARAYTLENAMAGNYLISVSTVKEDGTTLYGQKSFRVEEPYTLTLEYDVNGGQVCPTLQYKLSENGVASLRRNHSTDSDRIYYIQPGTVLNVSKLYESYDYTWAKTEYNGATGWIALTSAFEQLGYLSDESGQILCYPKQTPLLTQLEYAKTVEGGLVDPEELELTREHHRFIGWSESADGSGSIYDPYDADFTTTDIRPEFRNEDVTIRLYAVWEKLVETISVNTLPDKTQYYTGEALDLTGLSLNVTYQDGTTETVTEGISAPGESMDIPGEKTVTLTYRNETVSVSVTVLSRLLTTVTDDGVTIDGYIGAEGELILPSAIGGKKVTAIAAGAFENAAELTGILIPAGVTQIGDNAFAGCTALENVYYTGNEEQWNAIARGSGNEALLMATVQIEFGIPGDMNQSLTVDEDDAIFLLRHVLFPEIYLTDALTDLNGDGVTNEDDAIFLLRHVLFPEIYPL